MRQNGDDGFCVRDSKPRDISLYAQLLRNEEWLHDSGFKREEYAEDAMIGRFLQKEHPDDIKWVCFHADKGFVGFLHFNVASNDTAITIGGIVPHYLNSGLGVKYYAWCIDLYFSIGRTRKLHSNIYQENIRSCKMNLGLGFELVGLKRIGNLTFDVYEVDRERFYKAPLTVRVLKSYSHENLCKGVQVV